MPRLIFIGGISGVGKSTLLDHVPGRDRAWIRMSASRLIAEELGVAVLPVRSSADVEHYQDALVRGYCRQAASAVLPLAMDGHFMLRGSAGRELVPERVFRALSPDVLVLLHASRDAVGERLASRGDPVISLDEITADLAAERDAARAIAATLGVALHELPAEPSSAGPLARLIEERRA